MRNQQERSGFTLIELIVVVGIVAVLMGLIFVAVSSAVSWSRSAATETTIKKINMALWYRNSEIGRYFISEDRAPKNQAPNYESDGRPNIPGYIRHQNEIDLYNGEGTYAGQAKPLLAKLLARKRFVRRAFPMTFAEAGISPDNPANHKPETENAEVLYHLLTDPFSVGTGLERSLSLSSREVVDSDNDGLMEVVDAWGKPLRFYRWPTRLIRPQPQGSETATQDENGTITTSEDWFLSYGIFSEFFTFDMDPDDEFGTFISERNQGTFTSEWFENNIHTIETWHSPLVVSAGEDGELGLYEPDDTVNYGNLAQPDFSADHAMQDDISSWELGTIGH